MKKFNGKLLTILSLVLSFALFTSTLASPAFAQTAQKPNPQPCKNPVQNTDKNAPNYQSYDLTDNFITDSSGDTSIKIQAGPFTGKPNEIIHIDKPDTLKIPVTIDFSKLQAIFASDTSNYLEGKFQDQNHQGQNLMGASSTDLNNYYGANQKIIPKYLTDLQKIKYIDYVSTHPNLIESANQISDTNGQNPKTIYDMVSDPEFGKPKPAGEQQDPNTWGKYWSKIPTTYSEFYQGQIEFRFTLGQDQFERMKAGSGCATPLARKVKFVMPDFFRTAAVSDQLNQVLIPFAAQTDPKHTILQANTNQNLISSIITTCKQLIAETPKLLKDKIGKIVSISLNFLNPIKTAFAAQLPCIPIQKDAKNGTAPYCPLPTEEVNKPDVSCTDKNDPLNLDQGNKKVVCTFTISWPGTLPNSTSNNTFVIPYTIDPSSPDCSKDLVGETYTCRPTLRIFIDFRIPWAARVWNNTTDSDTNKPGVFTIFTPKSVMGEKVLPQTDAPGKSQDSQPQSDIRINNVGGVACNQYFSKNLALKPIALQQALGISQDCGQ